MQVLLNVLKLGVCLVVLALFSGCANKGDNNTDSAKTEYTEEKSQVKDPAVQAVLDSKQIEGTEDEIKTLLDQRTFLFGFDKSNIDEDYQSALDVQAVYLNSNMGQDQRILIEGHTDKVGTSTYNVPLGERRANAVKSYLISRGVSGDRIDVKSYGSEMPVSEDDDAMNRRAVVIIQ